MYKHSLTEFKLSEFKGETHVSREILVKGGRTGRMVHRAYSGSSCLGCGHWCKHVVDNWKVTVQQADRMERCEKCFGGKWQEQATATPLSAAVEYHSTAVVKPTQSMELDGGATLKVAGRTFKVKANRYGNWYGYQGSTRVTMFFGDYVDQMFEAAAWLNTLSQAAVLATRRRLV